MAVDGEGEVILAISERPDIILVDLSLPVVDGWEATRRIKATIETASIPVIALTSHAMAGDREKSFDAGCDGYETKPVDFERLLEAIKTLSTKEAE
jgi:CheY-like chemotaxis protein